MMDWLIYLSGFITLPIIVGLSTWFGKIWANHFLEKDRVKYQTQMETLLQDLRTRDDKELYVHKLQFEKEFEIYKELWVKVIILGRSGNSFRELQKGPPEDIDAAIKKLCDDYNSLNKLVYLNRPFYAPSIYALCKKLLKIMSEVNSSISKQEDLEIKNRYSNALDGKLFQVAEKREECLDEFFKIMDDLCDAIAKRIWSTTKTGWDRNV